MDERAGWTSGALAGSLSVGLAVSGLMIAKELQSGQPSDRDRLGTSRRRPPRGEHAFDEGMPGLAEQSGVQAAHLSLSAIATVLQWLPSRSRGAPA